MLTNILSHLKLNCNFGGYTNISCKKFSAVRYCLRKTILLCLKCNQLDEAEDNRPNMFNSQYGAFDGASWEKLCQLIFKRKYEKDDYQKIPASPGDFGLEGFTLITGWGFQCYCPNKHYEQKELFEKQRDKITSDLKKLSEFQKDLTARLGNTKLCKWIFVTPEYNKNELIKHARIKEQEIRDLNLPFLTDNFTVLLRDADDYALEIREFQTAMGEVFFFSEAKPLIILDKSNEEYEQNIDRKNRLRLKAQKSCESYELKLAKLNKMTISNFLACDPYLRNIESQSPPLYLKLLRLVGEFENTVREEVITWTGEPEELTDKLRALLSERILDDLKPNINTTTAGEISRKMLARWLAICELDYD